MLYLVQFADGRTAERMRIEPDAGETIARHAELPRSMLVYERFDWDTGEISTDVAALEEHLIGAVGGEADRLNAAQLGPTEAKRYEYLRKSQEALSDYGPWPFFAAEAEARQISIEDVRYEVLEAMSGSQTAIVTVAACARVAKIAIRNAPTAEEKLAAFAAIEWPTTGGTID